MHLMYMARNDDSDDDDDEDRILLCKFRDGCP